MFDTFLLQFLSLPDTVMYYITQNPSSPKGYQKLIQSCKYFFAKNPILVFHCLTMNEEKYWQRCSKKTEFICLFTKLINCKNTVAKLWIYENLYIWPSISTSSNIASSVIPKFYKYEMIKLVLFHQVICFEELLLFSSVKSLILRNTKVLSKYGSPASLEKIIECFPNLDEFDDKSDDAFIFVSQNTMNELLKIPHFHEMNRFALNNIPESFDIDICFNKYIKKNNYTKIVLCFSDTISETYKNRLETIVDEILKTESPSFKFPNICYPGMNHEKRKILLSRACPI